MAAFLICRFTADSDSGSFPCPSANLFFSFLISVISSQPPPGPFPPPISTSWTWPKCDWPPSRRLNDQQALHGRMRAQPTEACSDIYQGVIRGGEHAPITLRSQSQHTGRLSKIVLHVLEHLQERLEMCAANTAKLSTATPTALMSLFPSNSLQNHTRPLFPCSRPCRRGSTSPGHVSTVLDPPV